MTKRILFSGGSVLALVAACGGQTQTDDAGGAGPLAGAPGAGGSGADAGSGATFGSGASGSGASFGAGGAFGTGASTSGGTGGGSTGPCAAGAYDTDPADDIVSCALWSDCPQGSRRLPGSASEDATCEPCPDETYSLFENSTLCLKATRCRFSEDEVTPPTRTTDRSCEASELFPALESTSSAGSLAVTTTGAYLSYWGYGYGNAEIVRYSLDGAEMSTLTLDELTYETADLAYLGSHVYAGGYYYDSDADDTVLTEFAFINGYDQNGELDFAHVFDDDASEHYSQVRIAAEGDSIYLVAIVTVQNCTETAGGEVNCGSTEPPRHLVLRVLDDAGEQTFTTTLEEDTTFLTLADLAVATDGHLYLAGWRTPQLPQDYEADMVVLELNPLGEVVTEHEFAYGIAQLAPDESGNVYALPMAYQQLPNFYRFAAFGELFEGGSIALEADESIDAYAGTSAGLIAVGSAGSSPLLLTIDQSGEVEGREVLEDVEWAGGVFAGVQTGASGAIYLAGWDGEMFVDTWP